MAQIGTPRTKKVKPRGVTEGEMGEVLKLLSAYSRRYMLQGNSMQKQVREGKKVERELKKMGKEENTAEAESDSEENPVADKNEMSSHNDPPLECPAVDPEPKDEGNSTEKESAVKKPAAKGLSKLKCSAIPAGDRMELIKMLSDEMQLVEVLGTAPSLSSLDNTSLEAFPLSSQQSSVDQKEASCKKIRDGVDGTEVDNEGQDEKKGEGNEEEKEEGGQQKGKEEAKVAEEKELPSESSSSGAQKGKGLEGSSDASTKAGLASSDVSKEKVVEADTSSPSLSGKEDEEGVSQIFQTTSSPGQPSGESPAEKAKDPKEEEEETRKRKKKAVDVLIDSLFSSEDEEEEEEDKKESAKEREETKAKGKGTKPSQELKEKESSKKDQKKGGKDQVTSSKSTSKKANDDLPQPTAAQLKYIGRVYQDEENHRFYEVMEICFDPEYDCMVAYRKPRDGGRMDKIDVDPFDLDYTVDRVHAYEKWLKQSKKAKEYLEKMKSGKKNKQEGSTTKGKTTSRRQRRASNTSTSASKKRRRVVEESSSDEGDDGASEPKAPGKEEPKPRFIPMAARKGQPPDRNKDAFSKGKKSEPKVTGPPLKIPAESKPTSAVAKKTEPERNTDFDPSESSDEGDIFEPEEPESRKRKSKGPAKGTKLKASRSKSGKAGTTRSKGSTKSNKMHKFALNKGLVASKEDLNVIGKRYIDEESSREYRVSSVRYDREYGAIVAFREPCDGKPPAEEDSDPYDMAYTKKRIAKYPKK